jgi:hypothetical protein
VTQCPGILRGRYAPFAQRAFQAGGAEGREVTEDDERRWRTEWLNADPNGFALELWMERGSASVLYPRAFLRARSWRHEWPDADPKISCF